MRHRLEEDVGRLQIGEEQAVRIARDGRTPYLLVFGHLLVERHVERQRTVHDDVAQLAAVGHLGQQRAFGRGDDVGEQLLRGGDAGDFRRLDAQQVGRAGEVADLHGLLLEVGQRNHGDVRDDEQLVVAGHLDDRDVAQHAFRGEQPGLLVEDAAHVLVRRDQPLHQHVGVAGDHGGDGLLHALHVVGFVHDVEGLQVEAVLLADPFDRGLVAVERRLHQPLLVGLIDGLQRMRILPVGYGKTFFTSLSRLFDDFRKMLNHSFVSFDLLSCVRFISPDCRCPWRSSALRRWRSWPPSRASRAPRAACPRRARPCWPRGRTSRP